MSRTEDDQRRNLKKTAIWILGSIVMAIAGNAMWEFTRPGLLWLGKVLLGVSTLGMAKFRDGLYEDIAKGNFDWYGQWLNSISTAALAALVMMAVVLMWVAKAAVRREEQGLPASKAIARTNAILESNWTLGIYLILSLALISVGASRVSYLQAASRHLDQMQRIVSPYLSDTQRRMFESRIAQMDTRADFVTVHAELVAIAQKNGAHVPEFEVF